MYNEFPHQAPVTERPVALLAWRGAFMPNSPALEKNHWFGPEDIAAWPWRLFASVAEASARAASNAVVSGQFRSYPLFVTDGGLISAITRGKPQEGSKEPSVKTDNASSEPKGQELVYSARVSLDRTQMQIEDKLVNLSPGMAVLRSRQVREKLSATCCRRQSATSRRSCERDNAGSSQRT
jgi:hypothetical protein